MNVIDQHTTKTRALWAAMKAFYPDEPDVQVKLNGHTNHGDGYRYYASVDGAPKKCVTVIMDYTRDGEAIKVEVKAAGEIVGGLSTIATYEGEELNAPVCGWENLRQAE